MADSTQFETMTNVELRAELKRRGYSTTGNKKDLLAKLHSAVDEEHQQRREETSFAAANVMKVENDLQREPTKETERLGEQANSTSPADQTKAESKSIVEEKPSIDQPPSVEKKIEQDDFSSTSDKENLQKRELEEEKAPTVYKKLKRSDFSSPATPSASSTFIKAFPRATSTRVNLSSNLLQTLIPDATLLAESVTNDDLDRHINDHSVSAEPMTIGDLVDRTHQRTRTVVLDRIISEPNGKKTHENKTNGNADEPIRVKAASQAKGKATRVLHITALTRPFTVAQLRELLRRYGSVADDHCWVDKVKSQCLVMYKSVDEAEVARQSLDGCRWPTTNPKSMSIRFARPDEFNFSKTNDLPPDQMTLGTTSRLDSVDRFAKARSVSPTGKSPVQPSKKRSETNDEPVSGFLIDEDEPTGENQKEAPKTLDDFFRKTDAKPCIYWLPLTEEEVIERDNRKAERQKKRRDEPNSTFKDKTNANSERRQRRRHSSSSSREKHKQRSPLAKRDAKRH